MPLSGMNCDGRVMQNTKSPSSSGRWCEECAGISPHIIDITACDFLKYFLSFLRAESICPFPIVELFDIPSLLLEEMGLQLLQLSAFL